MEGPYLHDKKDQVEEEKHESSSKIVQSTRIDTTSSERQLLSLNINKNLNIKSSQKEELHTKAIKKSSILKCIQNTTGDDLSNNIKHEDNIVEQVRNGCDKALSNQKYNSTNLSDTMQPCAPSCDMSESNVPTKNRTDIPNSTFVTPSLSVIQLAGQSTTKRKDAQQQICGTLDQEETFKSVGEEFRDANCQSKRQSPFLKSQSLEIVQDSPSFPYNNIDDVQDPFFQLSETETGELYALQHYCPKNGQDLEEYQQKSFLQQNSQIISEQNENHEANSSGVIAQTSSSVKEDTNCENVDNSRTLLSKKTDTVLKTQSLESRPIYPNVPYSPYASPYSSPRTNRRRPPLRESRRVSIEQSGSFLQLNQYKLLDQIGQGSYGLVKLAYSEEDSTHYAMKILSKRRLLRQAGLMKRGPKKGTSPLERVYREIAVLKKLDHPNVVKLIEVLDDPVEDSLYMVFELVKQGEVLSIPTNNPLSEERTWSVFRDTLLGLEYLHYQRIVHADIKPGNLLLTECGRVKIADLGVCNEFIGEDATMTNGSTAGTPAFRAPESLNVGQNIYCGKAADIWALGATLYALVYGNVPFVASSVPVLYEKIKNEELSFPENPIISAELKDCIKCILNKDPAKRITLPQLKEHTWVTVNGLCPLPSEEENCRLVQVSDDDINTVVRSIPKLDTLILIKTMLKKHSFGNPFSRGVSGRAPLRGGSRLERFIRAGRSNSAPGSYNMIVERQISSDNILPALNEHSVSNSTNEDTH